MPRRANEFGLPAEVLRGSVNSEDRHLHGPRGGNTFAYAVQRRGGGDGRPVNKFGDKLCLRF